MRTTEMIFEFIAGVACLLAGLNGLRVPALGRAFSPLMIVAGCSFIALGILQWISLF